MTATQFLNQALDLDNQISFKREQLEMLRTLAGRCTSTLDAVPGGGAKDPHGPLESLTLRMAELETEIEQDGMELVAAQQRIVEAIYMLPDANMRRVLELRYLEGLSVSEIARVMRYSLRHAQRLCYSALDEFENLSYRCRSDVVGMSLACHTEEE